MRDGPVGVSSVESFGLQLESAQNDIKVGNIRWKNPIELVPTRKCRRPKYFWPFFEHWSFQQHPTSHFQLLRSRSQVWRFENVLTFEWELMATLSFSFCILNSFISRINVALVEFSWLSFLTLGGSRILHLNLRMQVWGRVDRMPPQWQLASYSLLFEAKTEAFCSRYGNWC